MQLLKYCLLLILCPCLKSFSQPGIKNEQAIKINETVPDITFTNVYNYPSNSIKLSSLKGKLVILDFWGTWCTLCIEAFSKMQRLQNEFGGQVQMLLVNSYKGDDIKKVAACMQKRETNFREKISLPYSIQQTKLDAYFPHQSVPHYAWIDKNGKLIAITSQLEITSANIKAAIAGNTTGMHMKQDQFDFDYTTPLFVDGNGGSGKTVLYRAVFSNYVEGLPSTENIESTDEKVTRMYYYNRGAMDLLRTAYRGMLKFTPNRIIINVADSEKFQFGATQDTLLYKNTFCYDISMQPVPYEQALLFMQQDLYRTFHVKVKNEERNMPCLVLKNTPRLNKLHTGGGNRAINIDGKAGRTYLQNHPVSTFISLLNDHPAMRQSFVIANDIPDQDIDIEFPAGFWAFDLNTLKEFLQGLGFELSETTKKLEVAVITDKE